MFYLVIAGLGYYFYKTRNTAPPEDYTMTVPEDGQHGQPSQISPIRKYIMDPRVDTANQPWYGGGEVFQDLDAAVTKVGESVEQFWWEMDNHNSEGQKDPYALVPMVPDSTKEMYALGNTTQIFGEINK